MKYGYDTKPTSRPDELTVLKVLRIRMNSFDATRFQICSDEEARSGGK